MSLVVGDGRDGAVVFLFLFRNGLAESLFGEFMVVCVTNVSTRQQFVVFASLGCCCGHCRLTSLSAYFTYVRYKYEEKTKHSRFKSAVLSDGLRMTDFAKGEQASNKC